MFSKKYTTIPNFGNVTLAHDDSTVWEPEALVSLDVSQQTERSDPVTSFDESKDIALIEI